MKNPVFESVDQQEVIDFLSKLVKIPSVNPDTNPKSGEEGPVAELIARKLNDLGFEVQFLEAQPGRPNIVGILEGREKSPSLWFNGHMDVQPPGSGWEVDPFGAEIIDGNLYGRGSEDMKAGLAAMIVAASTIIKKGIKLKGTLILNPVVDEVSGGVQGSGYVVKEYILKNKIIKPDMVIVCEPTKNQVRIAHRGIVWFELETTGKAAHGARPWLGNNAISRMASIITKLEAELPQLSAHKKHWILPTPNFNIGSIQGGTKINLVPEKCVILIDRRTLPGETAEEVFSEIREVIGEKEFDDKLTEYPIRLRKILEVESAEVAPTERVVEECRKAYQEVLGISPSIGCTAGFEDAHWFIKDAGIPTAMFGPYMNSDWLQTKSTSSGQSNEDVNIESVVNATKIYVQLMLNILG